MDKLYKTIDTIIAHQKQARHDKDYLTLMSNAEALLEYIPELINFCVEQESEYRKFEAGILDEVDEKGKPRTSSYAETKAKATDFYKEWQKAKHFIDLMYEMVMIAKKLASSVDTEFNAN